MDILYWFESIRKTTIGEYVLTPFFSTITHLGEETFFIVLGLLFFWCINKKEGYFLLSVGFIGTIINQFLKILCRVPRPWVKDKNFTIVQSAKAGAGGYSFPSGHTQSSVGIFGGLARWHKEKWIRITGIILCVLVPVSRMYLGVHTPLDVGVSIILSLALIFGLYPIIGKCFGNTRRMRILLISIVVLSAGHLAFVLFYNFPADTSVGNLAHATKNAYKMLGCTLGIYISFEIDDRFIRFETDGNLLCQALKIGVGLIPILIIKAGLKAPLLNLFGGNAVADGIRYLLLVLFVGCVWPITFKYFKKITEKKA